MKSTTIRKNCLGVTLAVGIAALAGCHSDIRPLESPSPFAVKGLSAKKTAATRLAMANAGEPGSTQPGTMAATTKVGATTQASSQGWTPFTAATMQANGLSATASTSPVDNPDMTSRYVYKPGYDLLWKQAIATLAGAGFTLDRKDYRLGVVTTVALPSAQFMLFWRPDYTDFKSGMENSINNQRRVAKIMISSAPGKPDFMVVSAQVLVERLTNSSEVIGGPIFVEGSGFGRNSKSLRSDYAPATDEGARWVQIGHDPVFEKKLLDALLKHV